MPHTTKAIEEIGNQRGLDVRDPELESKTFSLAIRAVFMKGCCEHDRGAGRARGYVVGPPKTVKLSVMPTLRVAISPVQNQRITL